MEILEIHLCCSHLQESEARICTNILRMLVQIYV